MIERIILWTLGLVGSAVLAVVVVAGADAIFGFDRCTIELNSTRARELSLPKIVHLGFTQDQAETFQVQDIGKDSYYPGAYYIRLVGTGDNAGRTLVMYGDGCGIGEVETPNPIGFAASGANVG